MSEDWNILDGWELHRLEEGRGRPIAGWRVIMSEDWKILDGWELHRLEETSEACVQ